MEEGVEVDSTICKVRVRGVENTEYGTAIAKLYGVKADGVDENKRFNEASPSIEMSIMIQNPVTKGFFKPGKSYYATFTEAPE